MALTERASYAVCREHAAQALDAMDGATMDVRRVVPDETPGAIAFHCHCGEQADFFLLQSEAWAVIVQQSMASRTSIGRLNVYKFKSAFDAERFAQAQEFPTQVLPLKEVDR